MEEKKKRKFKSAEAEANWKKHQFGQPEGNKQNHFNGNTGRYAVEQRAFYRWCESVATKEDLLEYVNDEKNPAARRKFVAALMQCQSVQDFFDLTNQTHGSPKQTIENITPPTIEIVLE